MIIAFSICIREHKDIKTLSNPQCEGIKERKKIKKYNQIMNKILKNAADSTLGARSYETPAVTVMEVMSEGVLCASNINGTELSVEEWNNAGSFSW